MRIITICSFTMCFITIALLTLSITSAKAQALDFDVPTGFAVVEGDGLQSTTGGSNGQVVTATNFTELKTYCGSTNPLIILVEGIINGSSSISVKSNKTIIGKGTTAQLSGFGLDMNSVSNIIIRNLKITGSVDGIAARATHHLWIDHCEIWDCTDGLLDITKASSYCTVSWCKFYYVNQTEHRLACLIGGGGGTQPNDWGRNKVTYNHNWYGTKVDQRMPRLMYGQGHVYNNYYSCIGNGYCIGVGSYGAALIENNYFKGVKNPHQFMYDVFCHITANGNSYENTTGVKSVGLGGTRKETGQNFDVMPFTTTPYQYWMDDAIDIPTVVSTGASPKAEYSEIGLMPTPGQGAVNVKTNTALSWKKGTGATPLSYNVYFGTTTSPTQVATVTTQSYSPGTLNNGTVYYWRVDVVTASGTIEGKLWALKTEDIAQNIPVTGLTVSPSTVSIGIGMKRTLTAGIVPSNATNKSVTWTSGNTSIATVNSAGLVSGVALGTTTIEAKTADGEKTAVCTVDVVEKPSIVPMVNLGFNENSGTTVTNEGSVTATFTKAAIPTWSANVPVNGGASSVDFGTTTGNNFVESNEIISQLGGLTSFTITGWVNCRSSSIGSGGNRIVCWINEGAGKAGIDVVNMSDGSMKVGINEFSDNTVAVSSAGKITVDANASSSNWVFFAFTYNSSINTFKFFFGNNTTIATLDKSITCTRGAVGSTVGKLAIGSLNAESQRTNRSDRMFRGLIDQIQIFDLELPMEQIQSIQNFLVLDVRNTVFDNIVEVYPNPTMDVINMKFTESLNSEMYIQLLDLTGKKLKRLSTNVKNCSVDISDVLAGTYLLKISNSETSIVKRIIKQ